MHTVIRKFVIFDHLSPPSGGRHGVVVTRLIRSAKLLYAGPG